MTGALMATALAVVEQPALPVELTSSLELASDFARASKSSATVAIGGSSRPGASSAD
jgi:hypothetical protein